MNKIRVFCRYNFFDIFFFNTSIFCCYCRVLWYHFMTAFLNATLVCFVCYTHVYACVLCQLLNNLKY